ncbi:MAG: hypothetical protein M1480_04465, partial [Bacteroidetes bacterium]|nr:hypothetical protein [Bacteroidota bacterium]
FQKIVYAFAFRIYYDLFLTPRIISAIFGLFTLLSLIDLSFQLFKNKNVSVLTGFFGTIFLPISIFSVLPLLEIYFFFFTVMSITFYFRWKNNEKYFYLWVSIASSIIGTTIRYEAWLFTFFLFLIVAFHIFNQAKSFQFKFFIITGIALLLSIFPAYWIYLSYITYGTINSFMVSVENNYHPFSLLSEVKNNALFSFLKVNISSLNIVGIISIISLYKKNSNIRAFVFLFASTLIVFSLVTFISKAMPTHNYWRLAMIWSLLLLPFTTHGIYSLIDKASISKIRIVFFICSFLILSYSFLMQVVGHSFYSYITYDDMKVGEILSKEFHGNNSNAYLQRNGTLDYLNILVTSQNPDRFVIKLNNYKNFFYDTLFVDRKLISEFKSLNIKYLVLRPYTKVSIGKIKLFEIQKLTLWNVYKINYL